MTKLPKQIVFALFNGESFGYVGSRKFVHDISNFTCDLVSGSRCRFVACSCARSLPCCWAPAL